MFTHHLTQVLRVGNSSNSLSSRPMYLTDWRFDHESKNRPPQSIAIVCSCPPSCDDGIFGTQLSSKEQRHNTLTDTERKSITGKIKHNKWER